MLPVLALVACLSPIVPLVPAPTPDLPGRALAQAHAGRPLVAWELLTDELLAAVAAGDWSDPRAVAEAELACLVLGEITAKLDRWPELSGRLGVRRPWPADLPHGLAFRLEHLTARALRHTGKANQARAVIDRLGYLTEWYLAGPFDNERGAGFDVAYPPELAFDREAPMPGKERPVSWRLNPGRQHPLARVRLDQVLRPAEQAVAYLATALEPVDPGPVVLRLGTSGPFKVFLGGREVASRTVERPLGQDQDLVVLPLEAGWNQLLIKLAVEEGPWVVEARLTDLEGRPHEGVRVLSGMTAWPDPPPPEEYIAFWALEQGSWTVDGLGQVQPDHTGHDHDDGHHGDDHGGADHGGGDGGPPGGDDDGPPPDFDPDDIPLFMQPPPPPPADWVWPRPAPDGPLPAPTPGSEQVLVEAAEAGDAAAARLLALWHLLVHPDDVVDRTAAGHAERAVALDDASPAGHYLLALANAAFGASTNEVEVNTRLKALQATVARDPLHVKATLDLAAFYRQESPQPRRVDELTARALAAAPDSWDALQARADHLDASGRDAEADQLRRRAESGPEGATRGQAALARAGRLASRGLVDQAMDELLGAYTRDVLDRALADRLIAELVVAGQADRALAVVERCLLAEPFDLRRLLSAADLLEHQQGVLPHRARELVTRALDVCHEHVGALTQLVGMDLRLGQPDKATRVLEEVLRLDPSADRERRHLALLTDEEQEAFETPWRRDARELLDTPLPESGNDPFEVLDQTVVWRVHPDGTEHRYEHLVLRVLNDAGARQLDSMPLQGLPGSRLRVHGVRVLRPDGSVEHAPAPSWRRGSVRVYDLPPLSAGDLVDVEWRADQRVADVFGESFGVRHGFGLERLDPLAPVRRSQLVVLAPPDVSLHVAARNDAGLEATRETTPEGDTVLSWVARDLPRPRIESQMPDLSEVRPLVDVSTFRDWNHFADWWWHFIEKEFVTTEAMRAKVAELTAGLESEAEKVEAIARFVGQEIRYNAWAFGTHGYEPYSAATIFERRFGDCKDKSILLRQLLAEIGVEAIPVLIKAEYARPEEPLDVAMVGHFNHCIAYLPATDEREGYYLDATADLNPVDYLRADDQGARVLHVTPEGGALHDIPYAPPEENALLRRYDVALDAVGNGRVELRDESNGQYGVRLRSRYGGEQDDLERNLGRALSPAFGTVDLVDVQTSDLEDIAQPARLQATFDVGGLWTPQGRLAALGVGFDPLPIDGLAQEPPAERRLPVVLDRPLRIRSEVRYRLPPKTIVDTLPQPVRVEAPGLLDYDLSVVQDGEGVLITRDFRMHVRRIELDDYAAFREALAEVRAAEGRTLLLDPPDEG